ncbi:hypothetical protein C8J56DRAFT_370482 [Mycena floridula]|nr:hypothetical protein C8J56DRAFT_370482 [Mycena floridula]
MPSASASPYSSSSIATPPRDQRQALASSSSSSTPLRSTAQNSQILTVQSLLASNANAPDPKLAALDQAVMDRNTLSSQNAQLWKLIEKQRAGYNQILKELERVRGERDSYKARVAPVHSERRHRSQERVQVRQHSDSTVSLGGQSSSSSEHAQTAKAGPKRTYSDELATPRSQQALYSSRSQDVVSSNPNYASSTSSLASSVQNVSSSSSTSPSRASKSQLTPLHVPPRAESLPFPTSATSSSPDTMKPESIYSSTRPLVYPRKASVTESIQSSRGVIQPVANASTPQTAPPGFGTSVASAIHPQTYANMNTAQPSPPPSGSNNSLLSVLNESRAQALSRDSRISLPDEARQYIASMADSPAPSPMIDAFAPRVPPNGTVPSSMMRKPSLEIVKGEFLDMEDEDAGDDDDDMEVDDYELVQPPPPQNSERTKLGAGVDDFPLPPSLSNPQAIQHQTIIQQDLQARAAHQASGVNGSSPEYTDSDTDTLPSYRPPPQQSLPPLQPKRLEEEPQNLPANFRALPLLSSDLPHTKINVSHSFVRPNDRGKEVLSFVVYVNPGHGKECWRVEKMYSDVLGLDQRVRSSVGRGVGKKIANLPEGKLWKDHAPAKVDQRKAVLENYLQSLINLPVKTNDEVIAFFTSDIVRDTKQPVMQAGHKEGYLTKRGKNFGGWKTRYFVLSGPVLEYFDTRGGAHLGSIQVTGAQIGRQQKSERTPVTDEEKEYRHAFLIVEAKKGPGGNHPRHVLCAESDDDRDSWVEMLVRYFSGTYSEEPVAYGAPPPELSRSNGASSEAQPRPSLSTPRRGTSRDDISISKGPAIPISQLPPDAANAKLFQSAPTIEDYTRSASPALSVAPSPIDRQPQGAALSDAQMARRLLERSQGQPSSLPDSGSPLANAGSFEPGQRAASEQGYYPDLQDYSPQRNQRQQSPDRRRIRDPSDRKTFAPSLNPVAPSPPPDRVPSPEKLDANGKVKISGPLNGAPIPAGYKFGGKEVTQAEAAANDRREKAKSRSFWGFGRPNGGEKQPTATYVPRAVFGVPLEESLDVVQIANLPAIVFRAIQYLEEKSADQEEGIYRLSGSSAVIKSLKDRFNMEGDIDLLASDEYWDPHAIAGLLKSFLRELPASILTRELHLRFLAVIDFVDPQERIKELSRLIAALPMANYTLLRALTAHLILIVQNSAVNKMTMRNVGIVFSPTLGIPAGVFSLMLGEFNRVFNVDDAILTPDDNGPSDVLDSRRNSRQYTDTAADQLLGLAGRTLTTPAEEGPSDGDDESMIDGSGTDSTAEDAAAESSPTSSPTTGFHASPPDTPMAKATKASTAAASRGLNVSVTRSDRGNRYSRMGGLPASPRPTTSPPGSPT